MRSSLRIHSIPDLVELELELEELAALTERDVELIETYQGALIDIPDREVTLRIKIAELAEKRLDNKALAIQSYQEILHQEPDHIEVMGALEVLLRSEGHFSALAELYNQKLDILEESAARESIYAQLAKVYEEHLEAPLEAIEIWRRQLEENERHLESFVELERLLNQLSSPNELAALYEEWIGSSQNTSESLEVISKLATLTLNDLEDGLSGLDLIRDIFQIDPTHQESIVTLSTLFADESRCHQIGADRNIMAELLEPIARGLSVEVSIVEARSPEETEESSVQVSDESLMSSEGESVQDDQEIRIAHREVPTDERLLIDVLYVLQQNEMDPEVRCNQLLELAELQERVLADLNLAFESRLTSLRLNPTNLENRHALQRLSLATQRYSELAEGIELAANEVLEIQEKSSLFLELGKIYESYLDDYERASFFYQEILNDAPHHTGSVHALETLYARLSNFQALVDLYLRLADESEDDEQRIRRLFQACEMMRHLDDHDQLIETYRGVLEIDEQNVTAYRELERLFHITEEWGALASLLQERIDLFEDTTLESAPDSSSDITDQAEERETIEDDVAAAATASISTPQRSEGRAELRSRLAKLLEQLNEYDEAIETWRALLDEDDDRYETAFESLEKLGQQWRSLGVDEPRRQTIAEILIPLYESQSQWEPWVRSSEDLLEFIFDPEERSERFVTIATVVESYINDANRALEYYALAIQSSGDNHQVESEIDRLIETTESWSRGVEIFESVVAEQFEPEEATRLWLKVASIYESKLNDDERTVHALITAREQSPDSVEAIGSLRRFYTERDRHRELINLLKEIAPLLEEEADRVEALTAAGQLLTQSTDGATEAIEVYQQLRQESPDDLSPLQELEALYRLNQEWLLVIEMIREQSELSEEDSVKIDKLHQISDVYGQSLSDQDEQISTLRLILEIHPTESRALETQKSLFVARGEWNELSSLLEEERSHYEDETLGAVTLDLKLAQVHQEHTQQVFDAVELYGSILDRRSVVELSETGEELTRVVNGLTSLMETPEVASEASDRLIQYFEESAQFDALRAVYATLISSEQDPIERSALSFKLGMLLRDHMGSPRDAFFSFASALQDDLSSDDGLAALQLIGGEQGMYVELVETYTTLAAIDPYSELSGELSRLRAKLCEHRLQDFEQATLAWEQSLTVDSEHPEALKALTGLYDKQQRWSDLVTILETRVDIEPDDYELRTLLGELIVRVSGDAQRAIEQWKLVLMDHPQAEGARKMLESYLSQSDFVDEISMTLEPIYQEAEEWSAMIELNMSLLQYSQDLDPVRREELWTECGSLYAERLNAQEKALEAYTEAFMINPIEPEIRERLLPLVEALEAWVTFAPKLSEAIQQITDPDQLVEDYLRLATWAEERLNDQEMTISSYKRALETDPETKVAIEALSRIYAERSEWGALAEIQQLQLDATYDEAGRVALLKVRAHNVWRNLGQIDEARALYEELITLDDTELSTYELLESLFSEQGDFKSLLDLYERKLDATHLDSDSRLALQKQMISVAESIDDHHRAIDIARDALEHDEGNRDLYTALERLYTSQNAWDDLRDLKEARLGHVNGAEKLVMTRELAMLCEQLDQLDEAVDYWLSVFSEEPSDTEVFEATHRLLTQTMRFEELIDLIERFLKESSSVNRDQRISLALELAQRAQEEGMQDRAVDALEEVLESDPNHPLALRGLSQAYEEEGDWAKATEVLNRALEHSASGDEKAEALARLGSIYMDQLDDQAQAQRSFERSLSESPNTTAIDALLMFARDEEREEEICRLLELKAPLTQGRERLSALTELASLYQRLGQFDQQLEVLERAYRDAPEASKVAEQLISRYLKDERLAEVEPIIRQQIAHHKSSGQSKALNQAHFQLGKLMRAKGDHSEAFELFERCRSSDPTFAPALVALSELYVEAERWEEAQELLSSLLIQRKLSADDRVQMYYLNGVTRSALGDARKAKDMFQRALGVNPDHEPSQRGLERLNS